MTVVTLVLSGVVWAGPPISRDHPPDPVALLSDSDRQKARSGDVVVYQGLDSIRSLKAVVYVAAKPEAVMSAIKDLPPRVEEIDSLVGVDTYLSGPHIAAKWTVDATVKKVDFYVIYQCFEAEAWCSFALDPTKNSDIPLADGAYVIRAHEDGVWLEYHSETEPPALIPPALREQRRLQSAQQMLAGIKARAEVVD
jgi:hypothetical protein